MRTQRAHNLPDQQDELNLYPWNELVRVCRPGKHTRGQGEDVCSGLSEYPHNMVRFGLFNKSIIKASSARNQTPICDLPRHQTAHTQLGQPAATSHRVSAASKLRWEMLERKKLDVEEKQVLLLWNSRGILMCQPAWRKQMRSATSHVGA